MVPGFLVTYACKTNGAPITTQAPSRIAPHLRPHSPQSSMIAGGALLDGADADSSPSHSIAWDIYLRPGPGCTDPRGTFFMRFCIGWSSAALKGGKMLRAPEPRLYLP